MAHKSSLCPAPLPPRSTSTSVPNVTLSGTPASNVLHCRRRRRGQDRIFLSRKPITHLRRFGQQEFRVRVWMTVTPSFFGNPLPVLYQNPSPGLWLWLYPIEVLPSHPLREGGFWLFTSQTDGTLPPRPYNSVVLGGGFGSGCPGWILAPTFPLGLGWGGGRGSES